MVTGRLPRPRPERQTVDTKLTEDVLTDVYYERERQRQQAAQPAADGTGRIGDAYQQIRARELCDAAAVAGELTWRDALQAEVAAVIATTDEDALREALVRATAVAVQWIENLDRKWLERQRRA